ncbi:MAG: TIGR02302 family protein, partial [Rhizobiaceae bacterium]|nr:TIGR02302 family protein [Hyphomicrobiales bacterium]NRB31500.1 TIGR02302 family protein [Rhizobiaceae bacterium]
MSLSRARSFAWMAETWERLWPRILPFIAVVCLFLTVSWLGLWPLMINEVRLGLLVLFAAAALLSLYPLKGMTLPGATQIDTRIERVSQLQHRPVTAQEDNLAHLAGSDDPFARALWSEHRRRMADSLKNLSAGTPVPKVASKDPFALRAVVALLLFIGFAAGWGNWSSRIGDAFQTHGDLALAQSGRIDAWLTPPAYTNRPPVFLGPDTQTASVPEGSELIVRLLEIDEPSLQLAKQQKGGAGNGSTEGEQAALEFVAIAPEAGDEPDNTSDTQRRDRQAKSTIFKSTLKDSSSLVLSSNGQTIRNWSVTVLPDEDPSIAFAEDPTTSTRGALEFAYSVEDDYGVVSAQAEILQASPGAAKAEPLIEAPEIDLPLPRRRATEGTSRTSQDLTAHPWAGAEVKLTLIAEDEAGQSGRSETKTLVLPERIFTKPLARAVVQERRNLALDANAAPQVAEMLDIITDTHPEEFIRDMSVYTALRVAYRSVSRAENKDDLLEAVELLWEIALSIEDGDLSLAERRLRDAQERLSQALENGASDEEIDRLMQELRAAMDAFMRELAQQMQRNPQNQQAMPLDPNTQVLRQQDLDRLMQQIEDLAKSGSRDAARQLLQELQRMMNNLQTARPKGQQQQQGQDQFSEQMNRLGEMMRQQQQLMDETFDMQRRQQQGQRGQEQNGNREGQRPGQRRGQEGQAGEQRPMTAEEFAEAMRQLQQQQGELQRQMQEMQEQLRGMGLDPGERLGEAGEAMGEAEQQLGQGDSGQATDQQGRALQAMREG